MLSPTPVGWASGRTRCRWGVSGLWASTAAASPGGRGTGRMGGERVGRLVLSDSEEEKQGGRGTGRGRGKVYLSLSSSSSDEELDELLEKAKRLSGPVGGRDREREREREERKRREKKRLARESKKDGRGSSSGRRGSTGSREKASASRRRRERSRRGEREGRELADASTPVPSLSHCLDDVIDDDIAEFPSPRRKAAQRDVKRSSSESRISTSLGGKTRVKVPEVINLDSDEDEEEAREEEREEGGGPAVPLSLSQASSRASSHAGERLMALGSKRRLDGSHKSGSDAPAKKRRRESEGTRKTPSISSFFETKKTGTSPSDLVDVLELSSDSATSPPPVTEAKAGKRKDPQRAVSMFTAVADGAAKRQPLHDARNRLNVDPSTELWIDKYAPTTEAELAVRKDRVRMVKTWLDTSINGLSKGKVGTKRMLVITGPCGAGKTALVQVLANALGAQVCEWTDPCLYIWKDSDQHIVGPYESRMKKFHQFMVRSERLGSLSTDRSSLAQPKKIILLEQLPYAHDAAQREAFNAVMREFLATSAYPLVFILSDENFGKSSINRIFTHDVLTSPYTEVIHVNPVVTTTMTRILKLVCVRERLTVPIELVERIVENSSGDLRGAINALQFYSLKDHRPAEEAEEEEEEEETGKGRKRKKAKKKKRKKALTARSFQGGKCKDPEKIRYLAALTAGSNMLGTRDMSYNLFRALGKVCYNKRRETASTRFPKTHTRYRQDLAFHPEELLESVHMGDEVFNAFLHENYLRFFVDIDDVAAGSEKVSDADVLAGQFGFQAMCQPGLSSYCSSIAARGLLYANRHPVARKFQPMYKPALIQNSYDRKDNARLLDVLFVTQSMPPPNVQLYNCFIGATSARNTQVLPLVHRMARMLGSTPFLTEGQRSCLALFSKFSAMTRSTKLEQHSTEKFHDALADLDGVPVSQVNHNLALKHRMALGTVQMWAEEESTLLSVVGGRKNEVLDDDDIADFDD